jgi:hypothetical protein
LIRKIIYFLGFIFVASFLAFNVFLWKLNSSFRASLSRLPAVISQYGLNISEANFEDLSLNGPKGLSLRNFRLSFVASSAAAVSPSLEPFSFRADQITLVSKDFAYDNLQLTTHNFIIATPNRGNRRIIDKDALKPKLFSGKIDGSYLRSNFPSNFSNPGESVEKHLKELASFLVDGVFKTEVALDAVAFFKLGETFYRVPLQATVTTDEQNNKATTLSLDASRLVPIKKHFGEKITNDELDFITTHPLDGALLVSIKDVAEDFARKIHLNDKTIPEEELRHAIYGFLIEPSFTTDVKNTLINAYKADTKGKNQLALLEKYVNFGGKLAMNGLEDSEFVERISTKGVVTKDLEKLKWSVK